MQQKLGVKLMKCQKLLFETISGLLETLSVLMKTSTVNTIPQIKNILFHVIDPI